MCPEATPSASQGTESGANMKSDLGLDGTRGRGFAHAEALGCAAHEHPHTGQLSSDWTSAPPHPVPGHDWTLVRFQRFTSGAMSINAADMRRVISCRTKYRDERTKSLSVRPVQRCDLLTLEAEAKTPLGRHVMKGALQRAQQRLPPQCSAVANRSSSRSMKCRPMRPMSRSAAAHLSSIAPPLQLRS